MNKSTNAFPIMLATWSFGQRSLDVAWPGLLTGGSALDAGEIACRYAESDLSNPTVGIGGLPDAAGNMSVDAAVMLSPARCGAVCAVETVLHPITLARRVMEQTTHKLIAGPGADRFALSQGLETGSLLTEESRRRYQDWISRGSPSGPVANMEENHDTIGVLSIDRTGMLAACCSTSGMSWKMPGRVGDSSIIGQGLYADQNIGCAVCTGHGELVMGVCASYLAVETLRRGAGAVDAVAEVLGRIGHSYTLGDQDQVGIIVLRADGQFSTGSIRPGFQTSVRTVDRNEVVQPEVVLLGK